MKRPGCRDSAASQLVRMRIPVAWAEADIGIHQTRYAHDLVAGQDIRTPRCFRREDTFYPRAVDFQVATYKAIRRRIEVQGIGYDPLRRSGRQFIENAHLPTRIRSSS